MLMAQSPDIWLAPQASIPPSPLNRAVDFMQLFTPDAPWRDAASHTSVFKLYPSFLTQASQGQVDTIVHDLNRRGIAIALEMGVMDINYKDPVPPCGGFGLVEGYGVPAVATIMCQKIKHARGEIRYLAMDEPVFYGHYFSSRPGGKQPGCHSSISQIVRLSVPTLTTFIQEFPHIVIGDVEPTQIAAYPGWQADYEEYLTDFRQAMGREVAFLHLDIPWANGKPSKEPDDVLAVYKESEDLRNKHLLGGIGIIYDGTPLDTTDASWMEDARRHLVRLTEALQLRPNQVIFQSWMKNPTHAMPDWDPAALTNIIKFYVQRYLRMDERRVHPAQ
jgi:hypothetical protein